MCLISFAFHPLESPTFANFFFAPKLFSLSHRPDYAHDCRGNFGSLISWARNLMIRQPFSSTWLLGSCFPPWKCSGVACWRPIKNLFPWLYSKAVFSPPYRHWSGVWAEPVYQVPAIKKPNELFDVFLFQDFCKGTKVLWQKKVATRLWYVWEVPFYGEAYIRKNECCLIAWGDFVA